MGADRVESKDESLERQIQLFRSFYFIFNAKDLFTAFLGKTNKLHSFKQVIVMIIHLCRKFVILKMIIETSYIQKGTLSYYVC
jgi:hypothetical protein